MLMSFGSYACLEISPILDGREQSQRSGVLLSAPVLVLQMPQLRPYTLARTDDDSVI